MPKFEIRRANGTVDYVVSDSVESVERDLLGEVATVTELTPEQEAEIEANAATRNALNEQEWTDVGGDASNDG